MTIDVIELAKEPNLVVGRGILAAGIELDGPPYALVSQPEPLAAVDAAIASSAAATITAGSLDEAHLGQLERSLPPVERIVGIGGGVTMDTAKYLAWKRGLPLLLAPSIVSVDASVTNTIALRRGGSVVYEGFVVATSIIADLDLIASAPPRLNRAGVGDLLSIQTGRRDWALGAAAGTIAFDETIDAAAAAILEELYELADDVGRVSDRAIEHIIRAYAAVNALLLAVGHSGPEEGSEHYFAYAAEAATGRSFVHGEIVGLGVVLMATLQENEPVRAASFLDHCRVRWRPADLELDRETLMTILTGLPDHVRQAGLAHSIIDERPIDAALAAELITAIPTPTAGAAAGGGPAT